MDVFHKRGDNVNNVNREEDLTQGYLLQSTVFSSWWHHGTISLSSSCGQQFSCIPLKWLYTQLDAYLSSKISISAVKEYMKMDVYTRDAIWRLVSRSELGLRSEASVAYRPINTWSLPEQPLRVWLFLILIPQCLVLYIYYWVHWFFKLTGGH